MPQLELSRKLLACRSEPGMNPGKLFDYLDGNLPDEERARIDRQLATDKHLQRELAVAREIHKGMRDSEGDIAPHLEDMEQRERAGRLGRMVATIFVGLVLANVIIGIAFIIGKHKPDKRPSPEVRDQVTAALNKAAEAALPPPTLADTVELFAVAGERDALADKVVAAAAQAGGSAAKALPNERTATVIAELPTAREKDFRDALVPLGAPPPPIELQSTPAANAPAKKLLQVEIKDRPPAGAR